MKNKDEMKWIWFFRLVSIFKGSENFKQMEEGVVSAFIISSLCFLLRFFWPEILPGEAQLLTAFIFHSRPNTARQSRSYSFLHLLYSFLIVCTSAVRVSSVPHDWPRNLRAFDTSSRISSNPINLLTVLLSASFSLPTIPFIPGCSFDPRKY